MRAPFARCSFSSITGAASLSYTLSRFKLGNLKNSKSFLGSLSSLFSFLSNSVRLPSVGPPSSGNTSSSSSVSGSGSSICTSSSGVVSMVSVTSPSSGAVSSSVSSFVSSVDSSSIGTSIVISSPEGTSSMTVSVEAGSSPMASSFGFFFIFAISHAPHFLQRSMKCGSVIIRKITSKAPKIKQVPIKCT